MNTPISETMLNEIKQSLLILVQPLIQYPLLSPTDPMLVEVTPLGAVVVQALAVMNASQKSYWTNISRGGDAVGAGGSIIDSVK